MSRSWERAVRKNTKTINAQRKKSGTPTLADGILIRGRSLMFTSFLLMVVVFLLIVGPSATGEGAYWFTVSSYAALALLIFLWRRPYLKIYKNQLSTRKWPGVKTVAASDIEKITFLPGYVIIHLPGKQRRWVFSRVTHLYPMGEMAKNLMEFATRNQVAVEVDPRMIKGA